MISYTIDPEATEEEAADIAAFFDALNELVEKGEIEIEQVGENTECLYATS